MPRAIPTPTAATVNDASSTTVSKSTTATIDNDKKREAPPASSSPGISNDNNNPQKQFWQARKQKLLSDLQYQERLIGQSCKAIKKEQDLYKTRVSGALKIKNQLAEVEKSLGTWGKNGGGGGGGGGVEKDIGWRPNNGILHNTSLVPHLPSKYRGPDIKPRRRRRTKAQIEAGVSLASLPPKVTAADGALKLARRDCALKLAARRDEYTQKRKPPPPPPSSNEMAIILGVGGTSSQSQQNNVTASMRPDMKIWQPWLQKMEMVHRGFAQFQMQHGWNPHQMTSPQQMLERVNQFQRHQQQQRVVAGGAEGTTAILQAQFDAATAANASKVSTVHAPPVKDVVPVLSPEAKQKKEDAERREAILLREAREDELEKQKREREAFEAGNYDAVDGSIEWVDSLGRGPDKRPRTRRTRAQIEAGVPKASPKETTSDADASSPRPRKRQRRLLRGYNGGPVGCSRAITSVWHERYEQMKQWAEENGHSRVPKKHIPLGEWVTSQRQNYRNKKLVPKKIELLEALPGWAWRVRPVDSWKEKFDKMVEFKAIHGTCSVDISYEATTSEKTGKARPGSLYNWVNFIQSEKKRYDQGKRSTLNRERVRMLNSIGFIWDESKHRWDIHFKELVEHKRINGTAHMPKRHGKLGIWCQTLRTTHRLMHEKGLKSNNYLTPERIQMLEAVGFQFRLAPARKGVIKCGGRPKSESTNEDEIQEESGSGSGNDAVDDDDDEQDAEEESDDDDDGEEVEQQGYESLLHL